MPRMDDLDFDSDLFAASSDPDERMIDDATLLRRLRGFVQVGWVPRWWFILLDEQDRQLPLLPQIDGVPRSPDARAVDDVGRLLDGFAQGVPQLAIVIERPGPAAPSPDDLAWQHTIALASLGADLRLRGVFLAHSGGVDPLVQELPTAA